MVNKIMVDCINGNVYSSNLFKSVVYENKINYLIEAVPIDNNIKQIFKKILLYVEKKDFSISMIDMQENSGDNTVLKFIKKEINTNIPDALFNFN